MKKHAAPIIAAILLLLPVLYVGSYLALVMPSGRAEISVNSAGTLEGGWAYYRLGDELAERFFWPLEQIDRKVRPRAWRLPWEVPESSSSKRFSRSDCRTSCVTIEQRTS